MKNSILEKIKRLNVIITTHVYATGPAQDLEEYLTKVVCADNMLFIGHPLFYMKDRKGSGYRKYKSGNLIEKSNIANLKIPSFIAYIKDIILTFYWSFVLGKKWDLFIGSGNLNAFVGLWLRKFRKVKKVVFYSIDYAPDRFSNRLMRNLYLFLDAYCTKNCDCIWNLSDEMAVVREKRGLKRNKCALQLVVPVGIHLKRIKRKPSEEVNKNKIACMGGMERIFGIQLVIEAFSEAVKITPNLELIITGTGPYEPELKRLTVELSLNDKVTFTGFIKEHSRLEEIISECRIGVAAYMPDKTSYKTVTDVAKPKLYLACGLPVIITTVPPIAKIIREQKLGLVVEYEKGQLVKAMLSLLEDDKLYNEYRENVIKYSKTLDWDNIFEEALQVTINSVK